MRPCTAHSVYTALSWIRSITCGPGKDFLSALTLALADPSCQVVQLLSTSLPDQAAAALRVLPDLVAGRPVNMFYLLDEGRQLDVHTRNYLHGLTCATGGSCYVIPVNHCGDLDQPVPLHCAENTCAVQCCCPPISACLPAQGRTSTLLFRGHLLHPATSCELPARTLSSSEFFPGCRVLARKEIDAFYYLATVIQQVQGHRGVWVVEFDCSGSVILGADFPWRRQQQQLVCSPDMVKHCETSPASLHCGDAVLSPWEPHLRRYGPGRVTAVRVHGDTCGGEVQSMLQVQMWHVCISLVPASLVQPISAPHYSRIVLELHKQTSSLHGSCSSWCVSACCLHPSTKCWSCSAYNRWNVGSSLERINGCDTTQTDDVMEDDTNVALSSSSDDEGALLPAVKRRGTQQRLPWRYWRRTGPEPQCTQRG
ncbi:uncharacterized protein C11orf16 homolog isoform X2 [Dunckerocampus dactyliophorus]|uniref:uncharacterized protein C11orf16 homolog isoform X2 n=1 Tax=Dunckerocampus dactyliophorus TaxID=161453 RepID=UPI0024062F67|nr:uncharacterized protein C11orf16 homolog isoform X2 [Dunckerocampus dactyliophorus]